MPKREQVLVIGLGRFGGALARTLVQHGHEVLGVDSSAKLVQEHAKLLTQVAEADATDVEALRQLGAAEFDTAIVGIGTDIEASILAVSALLDIGVKEVWAKAITQAHGKILERVGAHRVVFPERDAGQRVARQVAGARLLDYLPLDAEFVIVERPAPKELWGKSLEQSHVRSRYGITVLCVKPRGGHFTHATPETVVSEGDIVVIGGQLLNADSFSDLE